MPIVTIPSAATRDLTELAFVTGPNVQPTVTVDLNVSEGTYYVAAEDFDPGSPTFGAEPDSVGGMHGWREASLTIVLHGTYRQVANAQQAIARELVKPRNWLMIIGETSAQPMFLHTYRTQQASLEWTQGAFGEWHLPVSLRCDPWLLGPREDVVASVSVSNNPASGVNGLYFDVPAVKGDFETPAMLWTGQIGGATGWMATEPAPPAALPYFLQAEAATQGTDTAVISDGASSGSSRSDVTFATVATSAQRLHWSAPPTGMPVGEYRVLARLSSATVGSSYSVTLVPLSGITVPAVPYTAAVTTGVLVDLGVIPTDPRSPDTIGFGGSVSTNPGFGVDLYAARTSATGTLKVDYLLFLPAGTSIARFAVTGVTSSYLVFDGINRSSYFLNSPPFSATTYMPQVYTTFDFGGSWPKLAAGVANRIHFVLDGSVTSLSTTVSVSYWPRYLHMRPDTT